MKQLYILGAGGFGREVFNWAEQHPDCGKAWDIRGFVDDNPDALQSFDYPVGVVSSVAACQPGPNDLFLCGIGQVEVKQRLVERLKAKGATFLTLAHPTAIIGRNVTLGEGTVLCPRVILTCDIRLGAFVTVNCASIAGHDVVVGDWTTINGGCELTGGVQVGEKAFFGTHALTRPGVQIGAGATIGLGSAVISNVPAGGRVIGVPARKF